MTKSLGETSTLISRVDKNLFNNILQLRQFGDDALLMKHLLFFLVMKHQTSLFAEITFDINEVAEVLGVPREHLAINHPDPSHVKKIISQRELAEFRSNEAVIPGNEKYRIYDSQLENALYRLYTENLVFSKPAKYFTRTDENGNVVETVREVELERIVFLEKFKVQFVTTKLGRVQIAYKIVLNRDFVQNFNFLYTPLHVKTLFVLRKSKTDDLYTFLVNLYTILKSRNTNFSNSTEFSYLCKLAYCNCTIASDNKKALNAKFKILNDTTNLSVQLTWEKSDTSRFAYQPVITFPAIVIYPLDNLTAKECSENFNKNLEIKTNRRKKLFVDNFLLELTKLFPNSNESHIAKFNKSALTDLKHCHKQAHINTYKDPPRGVMREFAIMQKGNNRYLVTTDQELRELIEQIM